MLLVPVSVKGRKEKQGDEPKKRQWSLYNISSGDK